VLGFGGWVKYIAEFGLLCVPIFIMFLRRKAYDIGVETTLLVLLLTANLFDLLPNATITPLTWILAGALWGRIELGDMSKVVPPKVRGELRYSRFTSPAAAAAAESVRASSNHPPGHSPGATQPPTIRT